MKWKKKPCTSEYSAAGPFYAKLQTHIIMVFIPYFIPVYAYHQQIKPMISILFNDVNKYIWAITTAIKWPFEHGDNFTSFSISKNVIFIDLDIIDQHLYTE